MRIRSALAVLALLSAPLTASADFAAIKAGVYGWNANPGGWIQDEDIGREGRADLENELNLDSEWRYAIWAAIEHPLPLLPNLKLQYTPLTLEGAGRIGQSFRFGDVAFDAGGTVDSELDLSQLDVILYWEALDNVVDLDLGLNFKVVDGSVRITGVDSATSTVRTAEEDFTVVLPLLYVNAGLNLPFTGLRVGVEASGVAYSGNRLLDARASLSYTVAHVLNLEGGWRWQQLKLDDVSDISTDLEIKGPFLGASLHF